MVITLQNYRCSIEYLSTETPIIETINASLSVEKENSFFIKRNSKRAADGMKYFLTSKCRGKCSKNCPTRCKAFDTGFLPTVLEEIGQYIPNSDVLVTTNPYDIVNNSYKLVIYDARENLPEFVVEIVSVVEDKELRDYQLAAVKSYNHYIQHGIYFPRGILDMAPNAGKSLIAISLIQHIKNCKCLYIVERESLLDQLIKMFSPIFKTGFIQEKNIVDGQVVVAMAASLSNRLKENNKFLTEMMDSFNVVIVDEVHHAGAATYADCLAHTNAGYRVGLSGTPLKNSEVVKNCTIVGKFGDVLRKIENYELMDRKISRRPIIHITGGDLLPVTADSYSDEYNVAITENIHRFKAIKDIITNNPEAQILISCTIVSHVMNLYNYLINAGITRVDYLHGKIKNRSVIIEDFMSGNLKIIIASQVIKEGLNIPVIDILVLAGVGKSIITVDQVIGRAIRKKEGHDTVDIYDFCDKSKYLYSHFRKRIAFYKQQGYEIKPLYPYNKKTYLPLNYKP